MAAQTIDTNMLRPRRLVVRLLGSSSILSVLGRHGAFRAPASLALPDTLNTSSMLARCIHEQLLNKHSTDNNIPSTSL
jgi:hypothetical protein